MKRLDKFSLLIENEEMGKEVKRIADKAGINNFRVHFAAIGYYYCYENLSFQGATNYQPKENPLITFDQFKSMFEPKIIGYKCPMDLYNGSIDKGTIYVKVDVCYNGYNPIINGKTSNNDNCHQRF